jgi:hypothetical protein
MSVYWAGRPLELAPGKAAVALENVRELNELLDNLISAVRAGELDKHLARIVRRGNSVRTTGTTSSLETAFRAVLAPILLFLTFHRRRIRGGCHAVHMAGAAGTRRCATARKTPRSARPKPAQPDAR